MARSTALSSGALATASTTTLLTGRALLNSVVIVTDGTNAGTVTVYDNTAGSGKVLVVFTVPGTALSGQLDFSNAVRGDIGLTVVVTGTAAVAYVMYGGA